MKGEIMKNKDYYDLSKIRITKSTDNCGNKIWKIFYATQEDCWNTEPIAVLDREGVSRVQVWGEWAEMEHVEPPIDPKFKVGDYVMKKNGNLYDIVNIATKEDIKGYQYYITNEIMRAGMWTDESLLTLSPLDEKEHDFLQYLVDNIRPKINMISKHYLYECNSEYIILETYSHGMTYLPCFKTGTMYKNMDIYKEYTLSELGLKEKK